MAWIFLGERGMVVVVYLLIAGDLLLAFSGDFAAAAAGLFLLYSSGVLLSRYYALNREREREQTHRSV